MTSSKTIYKTDRYIDRAKILLDKSKLSKKNKECIIEFVNYCSANSLSDSRISKYLSTLRIIGEWIDKDFDKINKDDIITFLSKLDKSKYSINTKKDYKVLLKRFYKWLQGNDEEYPQLVKWIKTSIKKSDKTIPTDILTENDVKQLIDVGINSRDKAIISVLYESGARIGEIANLEKKDVVFDNDGVILILTGKTGMRRIRLIASELYLKKYMNQFKHKKETDPLWIKFDGSKITYSAISKLFTGLVRRSGLTKKITPHKMRHSRATHLAQHFTEAQMCAYLGWVQGSNMPATYVHLTGKDLDSAVFRLNGLEENKKPVESKFSNRVCKRCSKKNEPTASFCVQCGAPLSIEVALELDEKRKEADEVLEKLLKDDTIKELILNKLKEM